MLTRRQCIGVGIASAFTAGGSKAESSTSSGHFYSTENKRKLQNDAAVLSIGISQYLNSSVLKNAISDAKLVSDAFAQLGYKSYLIENPDLDGLLLALANFQAIAHDAKLAVIYVSGHGGFVGNNLHVFPTSTDTRSGIVSGSVPESVFAKSISEKPRTKLLMFDCCRQKVPYCAALEETPDTSVGGLFTLYSTHPNAVSYDGASSNGPFASALIENLMTPALEIDELTRRTRLRVLQLTGGAQIPWSTSSLLSKVVLNTTRKS